MACFCERIYKSLLKEVAFSFWTVHGWVSVHRHFNEVLLSIKTTVVWGQVSQVRMCIKGIGNWMEINMCWTGQIVVGALSLWSIIVVFTSHETIRLHEDPDKKGQISPYTVIHRPIDRIMRMELTWVRNPRRSATCWLTGGITRVSEYTASRLSTTCYSRGQQYYFHRN